jgi:hypothetical protein
MRSCDDRAQDHIAVAEPSIAPSVRRLFEFVSGANREGSFAPSEEAEMRCTARV